MSRHEPTVYLRHMLDHAREAVAMAEGASRSDLDADRMLALALTHLVEIIGEAAGNVHSEFRETLPDIPWSAIVGMRNRLIHGYAYVDYDILWDTLTNNLPVLIEQLESILNADKDGSPEQ